MEIILVYFLPTIIFFLVSTEINLRLVGFFMLNLIFAWTIIGWVVLLPIALILGQYK
jgi:hypothetical protein